MSKTLRERLAAKRKEIQERASSGTGNLIFIKEGTYRVRVLSGEEGQEWAYEIAHMYLGPEIKGIISPSSIGLDCPIMEKIAELKESKGADATNLIKTLRPKSRFLLPVVVYKDERGKEIDEENSGKLMLITGGLYGQMIDFFLDPDLGDFTDPQEGYDLKIKRTGKGMTDTEYSVSAMRPTPITGKWSKPINLESMVKAVIPSYDDVEEKLAEFMAINDPDGNTDDQEGGDAGSQPRPRKRKKRSEDGE